MNKLQKFTKAIGLICRHPYLLNLVLQDEDTSKEEVIRRHGFADGLPVIEINQLFPDSTKRRHLTLIFLGRPCPSTLPC